MTTKQLPSVRTLILLVLITLSPIAAWAQMPAADNAVSIATPASAAQAPPTSDKSRSRGFFLGGLFEGNGVVFENSDADSGAGFGVLFGYGFNRSSALYFQWSGASVKDSSGTVGNYGVGHFDVGARFHFLAPRKAVVPYVNIGVSSRAIQGDIGTATLKANGVGVAFGGGVDAHFTPAVAFTAGVTWSAGNIGNFKLNGTSVGIDSESMTTARVQLGIVWFMRKEQ